MTENLIAMLDSLEEIGIYVVSQESHRFLFFNRYIRTLYPDVKLGMDTHALIKESCSSCPMNGAPKQGVVHALFPDPATGRVMDMMTNRILWNGTEAACCIVVAPHKVSVGKEKALQQIGEMYASSLLTVFGECVIANLTEDYYVNCQKDTLWSEIPERGDFDRENLKYAEMTVHPQDLGLFLTHFSRDAMLRLFGEGKRQISQKLRRLLGDGTYHMVEFTAARIERLEEEDCWCVLVYRDIEEAYRLEQEKNVEIGQLATAAKVAYQMLISVNLSQNTYTLLEDDPTFCAQQEKEGVYEKLLKKGKASLAGEEPEEYNRKFGRERLLETFRKGAREVTMEICRLGEDGVCHWNYTQAVRVDNPYSEDVLAVVMIRNIDEEHRRQEENLERERKAKQLLEDALQKAEAASMAKSDFLSRMSHDIRTPMNAIMGLTSLAKLHTDDRQKLTEYLEKIETSSAHLLGLINEVLDVSKIESRKAELQEAAFDLKKLAQDALLLVQPSVQKKEQQLTLEIVEGLHSYVEGDEQRLRQILVNLLENASKYTAQHGRIHFLLQELEKEKDGMGTYQFVVEDNGIGIKSDYLGHIFEPFSRADDSRISKVTGTGLGLTIVQSLVKMMGGTICAESEYGKGSRFMIKLCLAKLEEEQASRAEVRIRGEETYTDMDFSGLRVLLVDDNELNQQIAEEMLRLLRAEVEIVSNGREAVEAVRAKPPFYYDLVFMDVQMPEMDGCEAARRIRALDKPAIEELPIIALTADAFLEDVKRTRMAGMNGHLSKPIDMKQLQKTLQSCVQWKQKNGREKREVFTDL